MKLLYIISNSMIGGAETVLKRLLKTLDKTLYTVDVLVTGEKGPLHSEYERYARTVYHLPIGGENVRKWLFAAIRREHYDAVHFINHWNIYHHIRTLKREFPTLQVYCSLMANFKDSRVKWSKDIRLIQQIESLLHGFIIDCWINRNVFPKATVVPNGISPELFSARVKKPNTVVWVGRMSHGKKVTKLMEIALKMKNYSFTIIGSEENKISKNIKMMRIPNLVMRFGLSEREVADILSEAEYFIFTSHIEAMPLTLLEAMAAECCCICEQAGDVATVIQDGKNGYLIPKGEDPAKWIPLNFHRFKLDVGKEARKTVLHRFTEDQTMKHHEFLYGNIGSHHKQTRIAFVWAYPNFPAEPFWEQKIDSMQHAIAELSRHHIVQVWVPTEGEPKRRIMNGQNIQFYRFNKYNELIASMLRFKPDMIFLNLFQEKAWSMVIAAFPNVWKSLMYYGAPKLKVEQINPNNVDAWLVQQSYLKPMVARKNSVSEDKVFVNPFCIMSDRFKPLKMEKNYEAIMVADFRKGIKRQDLLIRAWKHVPGRLVLVGRFARSRPAGFHLELQKLVRSLGLEDRVLFFDGWPHERMPQLINQVKVGVMTSRQEGGSRALTEVMACGLPMLVLNDCSGTITTVRNGIDGIIVDPKPKRIAAGIKLLLENYQEMGKAAAEKVHRNHHYSRMLEVYQMLINRFRPEVSVITTSMNRGKYLEDCIKSLIEAKKLIRVKVNHIIMDGESTDNSREILEKYRNDVYAYIHRDQGQTDALIRAMEIVETSFPNTQYIGWINADDYYLPNWLKDSLKQLSRAPEDVAMSCSDMQVVGLYPHSLHFTERFIDAKFLCERGNMVFQPTVLIRMSAFKTLKKKYGFYWDHKYDYVQDMELWARFVMNGFKIMRLYGKDGKRMNFVACLRTHPLQMSRTHRKPQTKERNMVLRKICSYVKQELPRWSNK